jgi:hypothetical protein
VKPSSSGQTIPSDTPLALIVDLLEAILKATKLGNCYVPFVYLTDEFVNSSSARNLNFVHGGLQHPMMDDLIKESDNSNSSWERAARRWLDLLAHFWPECHGKWEKYYNKYYFGGQISSAEWAWRI